MTSTTERYRQAAESGDVDLALSAFAENAVLHSPLTRRTSFSGHAELRPLLEVAFSHIEGIHFHTDVGDERTRTLIYTGRIGGLDMEETALFRLDDDGSIAEATLFIRPLPALVQVMSAFGPDIARRNGRPHAARLLAVLTKPLLGMVKSGDRFAVPLVSRVRH